MRHAQNGTHTVDREPTGARLTPVELATLRLRVAELDRQAKAEGRDDKVKRRGRRRRAG